MDKIPVIPVNASAAVIADLIEDAYGVPREVLERLADAVGMNAAEVAEAAVTSWVHDWLGY
jgi:hypothetical protein